MSTIKKFIVALFYIIYSNTSYSSFFKPKTNGVFKVPPYTVRDDQRNLRVKFQLNETSQVTLSEESDKIGETILLKREFSNDFTNLFIKNKTCTEARKFRFIINSISHKEEIVTLDMPAEVCQESPWQKTDNVNDKILTPIFFGHISDTQTRSSEHIKIAKVVSNLAKNIPFNFILNTGDIVDIGNKEEEWYDFFDIAKNYLLKIPMIAAIGNHDYYKSRENDTPELFQKYLRWDDSEKIGFYSVSYNHFELLIFNSNLHKLSIKQKESQWQWLESKLKENFENKKISIVSMHYPVLSTSIWTITDSSSREMRRKMIPLLEKYKVKLVLSGHTHLYERSFKNGVNYIIAGPAGGVPSTSTVKNPYMVFKKRGISTFTMISVSNEILVKTFDNQGEVIDELEIPIN